MICDCDYFSFFAFHFQSSLSFLFTLLFQFISFFYLHSLLVRFPFLQGKKLVEILLLNLINCIQLTIPSTNKLVLFVFPSLHHFHSFSTFIWLFSPNSFSVFFFFQFSSPLPSSTNFSDFFSNIILHFFVFSDFNLFISFLFLHLFSSSFLSFFSFPLFALLYFPRPKKFS